jgi:hypothetical protein
LQDHLFTPLGALNMHQCKASPAPIVKGDKFGDYQCPKNHYEKNKMKSAPCASAIGSIMYAQVCTCPDLAFYHRDAWKILE